MKKVLSLKKLARIASELDGIIKQYNSKKTMIAASGFVDVVLFGERLIQESKAISIEFEKISKATQIKYVIRNLISAANHSSGINEALTEIEMLKSLSVQAQYIVALERQEKGTMDIENKIKSLGAMPMDDYGREKTFTVSLITKEYNESKQEEIKTIKKRLITLKDKVDELNAITKVEVNELIIKALVELEIMEIE
jgi:hypothetical protein